MDIKISNQVQDPIYQQIATELRAKILSSTLRANEQLPSIRSLAKELEVGIITVKKAYEVLMTENLIFSKGAVGYFVGKIDTKEILLLKKEHFRRNVLFIFLFKFSSVNANSRSHSCSYSYRFEVSSFSCSWFSFS